MTYYTTLTNTALAKITAAQAAGTIASQASCAWMNTANGTVTGLVTVSNGQGVGVRVETSGSVTGLDNILSINNALPNVIA